MNRAGHASGVAAPAAPAPAAAASFRARAAATFLPGEHIGGDTAAGH